MHIPHQSDHANQRQLALEINGLPLSGGNPSTYTVQAAIASLSGQERAALETARKHIGSVIGIIDSHFDAIQSLFTQIGFRVHHIASEDLGMSALPVVAIACPHRHTRLDAIDARRFLASGGTLISSDRAIQLPGIATTLRHLKGRRPLRARISGASYDPAETLAPVWLDAGHLPVDPDSLATPDAEILAADPLTGDPLVVRVQSGRGAVIHSVPHWLQTPHPDAMTSVERRPLRAVPAYRQIGNSYPDLTLGGFMAQQTMLRLLLRGLANSARIENSEDFSNAEHGD